MFALNRSWLVLLALFLSFAKVADADLFPLFSDDGGANFSDMITVEVGQTTTVDVFLGQSGADTQLTDSGLFSLGLTGTSSSTDFGSITDASANPVFDFVTTDQFAADSIEWTAALLANSAPQGNEVFLGTFDFSATAIGTTTLTFADVQKGTSAAEADWVSDNAEILDEIIFGAGATGTFDLTIRSIPEPSSGLILLLAGLGVLRRRRR